MANRFHGEKKLVQRIFIQTGSQQIGGNTQVTAVLSEFSSIRKPLSTSFQPTLTGLRGYSPWEQTKIILGRMSRPNSTIEYSDYSYCCFLCL